MYYLLSVQSHLSSVVVNNPIHSFFLPYHLRTHKLIMAKCTILRIKILLFNSSGQQVFFYCYANWYFIDPKIAHLSNRSGAIIIILVLFSRSKFSTPHHYLTLDSALRSNRNCQMPKNISDLYQASGDG